MATITVDVAAVSLDSTELARALARGTSGPQLHNVVNAKIRDLVDALDNLGDICDASNLAEVGLIRDKLIP